MNREQIRDTIGILFGALIESGSRADAVADGALVAAVVNFLNVRGPDRAALVFRRAADSLDAAMARADVVGEA